MDDKLKKTSSISGEPKTGEDAQTVSNKGPMDDAEIEGIVGGAGDPIEEEYFEILPPASSPTE